MSAISPPSHHRSRGRTFTALVTVLLFIFGLVPGQAWASPVDEAPAAPAVSTSIPAAEFTFGDIQYWVGQGTNQAAFVIQWNDGETPKNLVWGYKWDGTSTGEAMLRAIAKSDPRFFALVMGGTGYGSALGGIGFDTNADGDNALYLGDDSSNPIYPVDGIISTSTYNFDQFSAQDPTDRWQSGWYDGYWSYWVRDSLDQDFGYSGVGMTGRQLTDGTWDYWNYVDISQWPEDIVLGDAFTPVEAPLLITGQPTSASVVAGRDASFTVAATGLGEVTYQWQQLSANGEWVDIPGATHATLSLSAVTIAENGSQYRAQVVNESGVLDSDWAKLTVIAFTDVAPDSQFFNEIQWLANEGITTGWIQDDRTRIYQPLASIHRDAMAAYLYRLAGSPEFEAPEVSPFTDVAVDSEYYKEITWLASKGITTGWPDNTFRPLDSVNRDAMAAFLYRYAGSPEFAAPADSPFNDVPVTSQFYTEIAWLASTGITTGWPDDTFRPVTPVARDAMAAFIYRFSNNA